MKQTVFVAVIAACLGAVATRAVAEPQPQMRKALAALEQAKDHLEKASADKGGHRVKAIALISDAITEVKAGIEFDNKR